MVSYFEEIAKCPLKVLRDLCEVEFLGGVFVEKVQEIFKVDLHAHPLTIE